METLKTIAEILLFVVLWFGSVMIWNKLKKTIYSGKDAESYRRKKRY